MNRLPPGAARCAGEYVLMVDPSGDFGIGTGFQKLELPFKHSSSQTREVWEAGTKWVHNNKVIEWTGKKMVTL